MKERRTMLLPMLAASVAISVSRPTMSMAGPRVADLYLDCLVDFETYAESVWQEAAEPPDSGYFGDGASAGNGGIRGTCGICVAYATLVRAGRGSGPDRERRLQRLEAALRYAALTHRTGPAQCIDGKQWGDGWQTALWAGSLGFAAALVEDELDPATITACRQVVAHEADRLAAIPPPSGYQGDSKAEENAWNSNVLALAAAWLSGDARAADWTAAAKRYLVNTYTVADTAGDPLGSWVTTTTLYPSFACENHGFFHPSYQAVSGMSLGDSLAMAQALNPETAAELRPFAEHNVVRVWRCLSQVLLDSGELAYPSGLDWSLHGYGQISYYAWLAAHFEDPTARWAEARLAEHMAFRQRRSADGRFTGEGVVNGFYRQAVMGRRVAFAWWRHKLAERPDGPRQPPGPFVAHLPDVGLLLQRSPQGFISLSYRTRTMGLVVPESARHPSQPYVVTPRYPSLIGPATDTTLEDMSITEHGFDAGLRLSYGPLEGATVRFVSFGDAAAVVEAPWAALDLQGSRVSKFPVGIENHGLTGGSRKLAWRSGEREVEALSGEVAEVEGDWVCVSDRYGLIAGPAGKLVYQATDRYNRRGAAEDDLHYEPDDPLAPRYAVLVPAAGARLTHKVASSIDWQVGEGEVALSFRAPQSGRHTIRVALPDPGRQLVRVSVAEVTASSASERHPPALAADGDPATFWCSSRGGAPGHGPTPERPEWLELALAGPAPIAGVVVVPRPGYGPRTIQALLDGGEVFAGEMGRIPLHITLPAPQSASRLRLVMTSSFDPRYPDDPRNVQVAEVVLVAPGRER